MKDDCSDRENCGCLKPKLDYVIIQARFRTASAVKNFIGPCGIYIDEEVEVSRACNELFTE